MKKIIVLLMLLLSSMIIHAQWWNPFSNSSKTGTLESAQQQFIDKVQYMTEREALSKEISYYKKPQITIKRKVKDLTGNDAIHECNLLLKENEEKERALRNGQVMFITTWNCYAEKEYALDHPNDIVGAEYYFEGVFTHYNNGYNTRKAKVLCLNGEWFVIQKY